MSTINRRRASGLDTSLERARELVERAQDDGATVATEAESLLADCPATDHPARSVALRAWGLAARWIDGPPRSIELLRESVREALLGAAPDLVVSARLSLAGSLAINGQSTEALHVLDVAADDADPPAAARLMTQRATILARTGHTREADAAYTEALAVFEALNDVDFVAMTLANRGYQRLFTGRVKDASADLNAALVLDERAGNAFHAATTRHNLGHLALYRGQLAEALRMFAESEREIEAITGNAFEVQVSHGEALLSAGLFAEAHELGMRISKQMAAAGLDVDRAEALLLVAESALALRDHSDAVRAAVEAKALFVQQGRDTWADRTRLVALQASTDPATASRRGEARSLAEALERGGHAGAAGRARIEAVGLSLALGDVDAAQADIAHLDRARHAGPVELRLAAWHTRALGQRAAGRPGLALRSVGAALRLAQHHQASLRATDLRAAVAQHTRRLALLGCDIIIERGDPTALIDWAERYRASSFRLAPVETDTESDQSSVFAELRAIAKRLDDEPDSTTTALLRRRATLVRELRDQSRAFGRSSIVVTEPATAADVVAALRRAVDHPTTTVHYIEAAHRLAGVVIAADRCELVDLGDPTPVDTAHRQLSRALHDLAAGRRIDSAVHRAVAASHQLDASLAVPLGIGDANHRGHQIVIVPNTKLFALPWTTLPTFGHHVTTVVPSATHWCRLVDSAATRSNGTPSAAAGASQSTTLLVSGGDLAAADNEIAAIAAALRDRGSDTDLTMLVNPASTVERVLDELASADVAHLACHGEHRRGNALFSHLRLADGELTIYELERLRRVPDVVVLSACESAATDDIGGLEMLGMTVAFLSLGTRSLVAGPGLVLDAAITNELMVELHLGIRNGLSVPAAWHAARQCVDAADDATRLLRDGTFNCYGV